MDMHAKMNIHQPLHMRIHKAIYSFQIFKHWPAPAFQTAFDKLLFYHESGIIAWKFACNCPKYGIEGSDLSEQSWTYLWIYSMTSSKNIIFPFLSSKPIYSSLDRERGSETHAWGAPVEDPTVLLNMELGDPGGVSLRSQGQNLGAVRKTEDFNLRWAKRMPWIKLVEFRSKRVLPRTSFDTAEEKSKIRLNISLQGSLYLEGGSSRRRALISSNAIASSRSTSGSLCRPRCQERKWQRVKIFTDLFAMSFDNKRLRKRIRFMEPSRRRNWMGIDLQGSWCEKKSSSLPRASSHPVFCFNSVGLGCLTQNQPLTRWFSSFRRMAAHLSAVACSMRSGFVRTPVEGQKREIYSTRAFGGSAHQRFCHHLDQLQRLSVPRPDSQSPLKITLMSWETWLIDVIITFTRYHKENYTTRLRDIIQDELPNEFNVFYITSISYICDNPYKHVVYVIYSGQIYNKKHTR